MINAILNGLLDFVISLISVLLAPIDLLITNNIPAFADILQSFGDFISTILGFIPWILSWFHIPGALIAFVCTYFIAKLTISIVVHEVKLTLAWYRKLVP